MTSQSDDVDALLDRASVLYQAVLGRPIDDGARAALAAKAGAQRDPAFFLTVQLTQSSEFTSRLVQRAQDAHLHLIHHARDIMVRRLLPPARSIIDLGGINAPLFRMGYSHPFDSMVVVDLPAEQRHSVYRDLRFHAGAQGQVSVHYCDMTLLDDFADRSFDLAWSGQSIEHVERDAAARMCREALRVLKPGGYFCLDTPNRGITAIHTRGIGGFIHPEHKYEYHAAELRELLRSSGFEVEIERGICEMPRTRETREFHYSDFVLGSTITVEPEDGYILFFRCRKPARG